TTGDRPLPGSRRRFRLSRHGPSVKLIRLTGHPEAAFGVWFHRSSKGAFMQHRRFRVPLIAVIATSGLLAAACGGGSSGGANCTPAESPIVTVTAYSNVYDVYGKLISTFQSDWKESHNDHQIQFSTPFGGSTTQAQNVIAGFPADVAALSLYPDIQLIEDAGLITHDPTQDPEAGIVASSAVVFDVRPGNPLDTKSPRLKSSN